jgi:hypothetical protein
MHYTNKSIQKSHKSNLNIQDNILYGNSIEENIAKKYLTQDIINSFYSDEKKFIKDEEDLGRQKTVTGGIIITTRTIGENFCTTYNNTNKQHIKNSALVHKSLCERREEPIALLFITLTDLVGSVDHQSLENKVLCELIQENIQKIILESLPWVVSYSKNIIKDYYSFSPTKLKTKLNFVLDDGIYVKNDLNKKTKGGLLLNGLLEELEFYESELNFTMKENMGFICQILAPNGLPRNKKWPQIDLGISFIGKRLHKEDIAVAAIRHAKKSIRVEVHPDVIKLALKSNKLYYDSLSCGSGYEGFCIYIWEVLYPDQLRVLNENELNYSFCKCSERFASINAHKKLFSKE